MEILILFTIVGSLVGYCYCYGRHMLERIIYEAKTQNKTDWSVSGVFLAGIDLDEFKIRFRQETGKQLFIDVTYIEAMPELWPSIEFHTK